jgi:hypothetical protein
MRHLPHLPQCSYGHARHNVTNPLPETDTNFGGIKTINEMYWWSENQDNEGNKTYYRRIITL